MNSDSDEATVTSAPKSAGSAVRRLLRSLGAPGAYDRFEHAIVLVLTALLILVVATATWRLAVAVLQLAMTDELNPLNQRIFQTVFGMIFTVMIALEFKRSLLITMGGRESVVRVRSIVLIAMLAMVRKFIILDLGETQAMELFALSAAILSLGIVYWLVRDQEALRRA